MGSTQRVGSTQEGGVHPGGWGLPRRVRSTQEGEVFVGGRDPSWRVGSILEGGVHSGGWGSIPGTGDLWRRVWWEVLGMGVTVSTVAALDLGPTLGRDQSKGGR